MELTPWAHMDAYPDRAVGLTIGAGSARSANVLVECFTLEYGRAFVDHRLTQSHVGAQLRSEGIEEASDLPNGWKGWFVRQKDAATGLEADVCITSPRGVKALRFTTTIRNTSATPVHLTAVSIATATLLPKSRFEDLHVRFARSGWMCENRWERRALSSLLVDISPDLHGNSARDAFRLASESGWSSGLFAPTGYVEDDAGACVGWQVEHNGGWTVELSRRHLSLGLALYGPTDLQHHWLRTLAPGEEFTTPSATLVYSDAGWDDAAAQMTAYRRALRGAGGETKLVAPVVFNDYLNTLRADPDTAKLAALIPAAAKAGAEVFCIDAGWFADERDVDWWPNVGAWTASTTRFDGGLEVILRLIRDHGMAPGLWIEPLAVGVNSPVAAKLEPLCMKRAGVTIVEQQRMRLDMRKPEARAYLTGVVDRMVGYGIDYLKVDDNYSIGSGPDEDADSPGDGLLEHSRAWAAWLAEIAARFPNLRIENCASGAMTTDYALLASAHLQSTSDLEDMAKYPFIAAGAPLVVLPEQAANWGVPQPEMTLGEVVSTLTTSLAGSLYLSGHLDKLTTDQAELVAAAVELAKAERDALPRRYPIWPTGLPAWEDEWITLAHLPGGVTEASREVREIQSDVRELPDDADGLLFVWHRPGTSGELTVTNQRFEVGKQLFPPQGADEPWGVATTDSGTMFTVPAHTISARVYRIQRKNEGPAASLG
ncbi:glycoside hydrolase family 36 protein [Trueperella pecoris]|uniref:glycoside hydrolase family 36 protein n=1 Tax=Trueperella pecoris TaxID=2733571 RepID=UPI001ABE0F66|nr:glycoside hydrolase family 36 protein [Trueperella pecoris]QTG75566.1 alpha-galactosidase [Trueperella pecoris]